MNRKGHTNTGQFVRWRNRNVADVDRGIGKTTIEILSQDRVAVIRQTRFIKALPFSRGNFGKLFLRKRIAALDADPYDARLQSLFDYDFDGELQRITLILFHQFAGDFGLPETTRPIESLNTPHVLFEKDFAVAPVTEQPSRGLILHARANQIVVEISIAANTDGSEFVAGPGIDDINHLKILAVWRSLLVHGSGGFEVAEGLKMVRDVAPAFV